MIWATIYSCMLCFARFAHRRGDLIGLPIGKDLRYGKRPKTFSIAASLPEDLERTSYGLASLLVKDKWKKEW